MEAEVIWNRVVTWFGDLAWWAKALWTLFGVASVLFGVTVTDVMQAALNYELPKWIPGFVESGTASLVLLLVGLVVIIFLIAGNRRPASGKDSGPTELAAPPSATSTETRTDIGPVWSERRHVTATPTQQPSVSGAEAENESFHWDNMNAEDNSQPQSSGLFLYLELTNIGNRWRRGLICQVTTPNGRQFSSSAETPDSQNRVTFYYPEHFDASATLEDGKYAISWLDAVDENSPLIASRELEVRQVVLSSHRGHEKPGQRLVLEASEAKRVVQDGVANYLTARSSAHEPLRDNESHDVGTLREGWAASIGVVASVDEPRSLGFTLERRDDAVPLIEAYCVVVLDKNPPAHSWPGPQFGSRVSNQFITFFPTDFQGHDNAWPLNPGSYKCYWVDAENSEHVCEFGFTVSQSGQVLPFG